jgi:hypothetical protein
MMGIAASHSANMRAGARAELECSSRGRACWPNVQTVGNGNKGATKNPDVAADYVMNARGAIPSERLNIVENALGLP